MAESKARIPEDDFVGKVVKDPKQPPDTLLLTGFLGKSSEDGHTRLYFDPELKNYVEIPQDAIQHWQEIPKETSPLGGYHVWIDPNAELIHGKVGPQRTKAKFFEGPIGAAAAAMPGGVAGANLPGTIFFPPVTLHSAWPVQCGATLQPGCATHFQLNCAPSPLPHICPQTVFAACFHKPAPILFGGQPGGGVDPGVQAFQAAAATAGGCPTPVHQVCQHTPHVVCPTVFQHCPSFGCPVTQQCPTHAGGVCTVTAVNVCGTGLPCAGGTTGFFGCNEGVIKLPLATQTECITPLCRTGAFCRLSPSGFFGCI
jgi:hypothetical protein